MRHLLTVLLIFLLNALVHSQEPENKKLKEDIEFLRQELPVKHVDLFFNLTPDEFNTRINQISSSLSSLNEETFMNRLFQLMVAIGDEHTRVEPPNMMKYYLPIRFSQFEEGIFVTEIDSLHSDLLLSRIVAINKQPLKEIIVQFEKIIPSHNRSYFNFLMLFYLSNSYILKGMGLSDTTETISYALKDESGDIREINISPNQPHNLIKARESAISTINSGKSNYLFQFSKPENNLYINYLNCKDDKQYPFAKFTDDLFLIIENNKPRKIIVDLRFNGGGNSKVIQPFLDRIKESYLNEKGSFYVLIGKNTFSSALLNAIDLKRNFNTILVGEPTAGSINHYGETLIFKLPNTQATVIYSTKYFETWKGHDGPLYPDIEIKYSVETFKENKDEALEYVNAQE